MKCCLSILLLLTTAFYVLPVKEMLTAGNDICFADMEKESDNKKEKSKELFSFSIEYSVIKNTSGYTRHLFSFFIPVFLHIVETPPPDVA